MAFSFSLIGFLVLGLLVVFSVALFVLGLVKKSRALWIAAIPVFVVGGLLGLVCMGMFWYAAVSRPTPLMTPMPPLRASSPHHGMSISEYRVFERMVGLPLPDEATAIPPVTISYGADSGSAGMICLCHLSVPAGFDADLAASFSKAQWPQVEPTFQAGAQSDPEFLPDAARLQRMSHYIRTGRTDPQVATVYTVVAAYDRAAGELWIVSDKQLDQVEQAEPKTQP